MNNIKTDSIIEKINGLTNEKTFLYLKENLNLFSEDFVNIEKVNKYPYIKRNHEDFFFNSNVDNLQKEVALKFLINKDIHNSKNDIKLISKWIIKTWGGIKGIKDSTIEELIVNLDSKKYTYNHISSWSKINSFMHIEKDAIYDSKVIYSLNWLLLTATNTQYYFLQPESRNKKLNTFPLTPIINFRSSELIDINKKGFKSFEKIYINDTELYKNYIEILTKINKKLWGNEYIDLSKFNGKKIYLKDYNFFTELLLFTIADKIVVEDIRKNIMISFN